MVGHQQPIFSEGSHIDLIGWVAGHLKELLEKQGKEVFTTIVRMCLKLLLSVCCILKVYVTYIYRASLGMEDREAVIR